MTKSVWRIAADAPTYGADDLSGAGAKNTGGRWNEKGQAVLYTAASRALACLETFVHLNAGGLPLNRYLVEVLIPDFVWAKALHQSAPAIGWDAEPPGLVSIGLGSAWLKAGGSALLVVPSVIVPEEFNVLINPAHADSAAITATKIRKWTYDPRMLKVPVPGA